MRIPYTHMSSFLLTTSFSEPKATVSFLDYVKSQIESDILLKVKERKSEPYLHTYKFLTGQGSNMEAYRKVLKFFYEDLTDSIVRYIKVGKEFELVLLVEDPYRTLPQFSVTLSDIEKDIYESLVSEEMAGEFVGFLTKFSVSELSDLKPSKMLALASALHEASVSDNHVKLELDWG